jgi:hypothetical protein
MTKSELKQLIREVIRSSNRSLLESGEYTVSSDKEKLLFDFYVLSFIKTLNLNPMSKDSAASFIGDGEEVTSLIADAEQKLLPRLKKDLLDAVFYAICCEMRHADLDWMFDFSDVKAQPFPLLKKYKEVQPRVDPDWNDDEEGGDNLLSYQEAYEAAKKIGATKNPKEFVSECVVVFTTSGSFESGWGGKPWRNICDGWLRLYNATKLSDIYVAIDYVYHLQHNSDSVFNKIEAYYKSGYIEWLTAALDFKYNIKNIREILPYCSSDMRKIAQKAFKIANVPQVTNATKEKPFKPDRLEIDQLYQYLNKQVEKVKPMFAAKSSTIESITIESGSDGDDYISVANNKQRINYYYTSYVNGDIDLKGKSEDGKTVLNKKKINAYEIIPTIVSQSKKDGIL